MICGGDVKVFFRFIQQGDEEVLKLLKAGLESFEQGKKSWFFLDLKQGGFGLYTEAAGFNGQFPCPDRCPSPPGQQLAQ